MHVGCFVDLGLGSIALVLGLWVIAVVHCEA